MGAIKQFQSPDYLLSDLLQRVSDGRIQLPDFQREWVWDEEHIIGLLASVSMSYPVGAIMMLETDDHQQFRPIALEGAIFPEGTRPEQLVLDGQQRLTSLFLSIKSGRPVPTKDAKKKPIRRYYYLDIAKCLDDSVDREEAIFGVPEDRVLRDFRGQPIVDLSTREAEFELGAFPVSEVFDVAAWRRDYQKHHGYDPEKIRQFDEFEAEVIERFKQYQVPAIVLTKETPKEAVCQVFEKVNTGGVVLTVFELLTATFAIDNFRLRNDWQKRFGELKKHRVLSKIEGTDFIQSITLLTSYHRRKDALAADVPENSAPGVGCKRKDMLKLRLDDYQAWADKVQEAYVRCALFMHEQHIYDARDVPYRTQFVPMAAIFAELGNEADTDGARRKIARWFWSGVFGELYGGTIESRFAKDLPEVVAWIRGGDEPTTVKDAMFSPGRLLTMRTRQSAAYKGLSALLLAEGSLDLRTGAKIELHSYFDESVDIHHLFPQAWCRANGIEPGVCDSIVNKAVLTARTNRMIGGSAPSVYLPRMERDADISPERMDELLASHLVDARAMRTDDFHGFFEARKQAMLSLIERALGKPVLQEAVAEEPNGVTDFEDESEAEFMEDL
ncbi:MAG: DUF262 domain-containing protein [Anaerosomatales bacterium]|nr:DUF262 domain-containing protein [Anaerosomatales bacterium]